MKITGPFAKLINERQREHWCDMYFKKLVRL